MLGDVPTVPVEAGGLGDTPGVGDSSAPPVPVASSEGARVPDPVAVAAELTMTSLKKAPLIVMGPALAMREANTVSGLVWTFLLNCTAAAVACPGVVETWLLGGNWTVVLKVLAAPVATVLMVAMRGAMAEATADWMSAAAEAGAPAWKAIRKLTVDCWLALPCMSLRRRCGSREAPPPDRVLLM